MQCGHCGAAIEGEGSFCDECGKPLREDSSGTIAVAQTSGTFALAAKPAPTPVTAQIKIAPFPADDRPFDRVRYKKKWNNTDTAISHWNQLIRGLDVSSMDFYRAVRFAVESRRVSEADMALVEIPEGGVFSAKREYLRVMRKDLLFDICAAPFGDGFFVSTWLGPKPGLLSLLLSLGPIVKDIPVVGKIYDWFFPDTYYRVDTTSMFLTSVHSAVLEVLDQMMEAKGIRKLSEDARKPIHRDFF